MSLTQPRTIKITVCYFAQARDIAGLKEERFELPGLTHVQETLSKVMEAHPRLREIRQAMRVVINGRIADEDAVLNDGDVVGILASIAGG